MDAIVEAAMRLLVESGRDGVTTNAVAERAGVSIGSVYQYFPNKESIFEALQERHRDQVMPLIEHTLARLSDHSVDVADAIVGLLRAMAALHADAPERLRAISQELDERESSDEIKSLVAATTKVLADRFGRSEDDVRAVSWLACTTVGHVGRVLVHDPPLLDIEILLATIGRMMRGLFATLTSTTGDCSPTSCAHRGSIRKA